MVHRIKDVNNFALFFFLLFCNQVLLINKKSGVSENWGEISFFHLQHCTYYWTLILLFYISTVDLLQDLYLYYFLIQYPGRTLVFANSKDCIRRLISIFTLLKTNPLPLHADMHQKQRLKNLEKFTGMPHRIHNLYKKNCKSSML